MEDPAACSHARIARAEQLSRDDSATVQRRARSWPGLTQHSVPGLQTLYVFEQIRGKPFGGGTGDPIKPGHPLRLRLQTNRTTAMPGFPTFVPVRESFYGVLVPRGIGPFRLLEIGADEAVLRSINLRQ